MDTRFTGREEEILRLLAEGLSNRSIAERLVIEVSTVKWYNRQIYNKLGADNRREAVSIARQMGCFSDSSVGRKDARRHNIPTQVTPFVGRERELAELEKLLSDPTIRLITVLAPGGMGKTYLALQAAENALTQFDDSVYFVELAPLSDPANIPLVIGDVLGYQFQSDGPDAKQQILDFLRNKSLLLVLDNYEHLPEGFGLASDILKAAPDVKILVTSRQRLGQPGETLFHLVGMDFPPCEQSESVSCYAAVRLFLSSARHACPNFQLTPDNRDVVARICKLVNGMPLAIVLASSWLGMLTVKEVADEIQHGLDFLETDETDPVGESN